PGKRRHRRPRRPRRAGGARCVFAEDTGSPRGQPAKGRSASAVGGGDGMKNAPRSMTRVATPGNERELVAFALGTTAARVEERCRELRCGTAASLADAV